MKHPSAERGDVPVPEMKPGSEVFAAFLVREHRKRHAIAGGFTAFGILACVYCAIWQRAALWGVAILAAEMAALWGLSALAWRRERRGA